MAAPWYVDELPPFAMPDPETHFDAYWARFLRSSTDPAILRAHFLSTSAGLAAFAIGVATRRLSLVLVSPAIARGVPALVRRLRRALPIPDGPVAFQVVALLKLWHLVLLGNVEGEFDRVLAPPGVVRPRAEESAPPPNMVTDHTLH